MPLKSRTRAERRHGTPDEAGSGKDLGNFTGFAHSKNSAHFHAACAAYSTTTYDPIAAFLPSRLFKWIPQVAKYWFHKKHAFRDYTAHGKGTGIYPIDDRVKISVAGDCGTGTDEARIVAAAMGKSDADFTIHLGDVYYVGDANEVRENFLGEKTSPYAPVKWPMGAKGSFALNGNHEMYADGNGYWRMVLPRMGLKERGSEWGAGQWASFFCLENKHWRIIGLDTGYNSTRFEWDKMPVLQRSKWLRKTTSFKPECALPEPLLAWLRSSVNPDEDKRGLTLLSHHGPHSAFEGWYQFRRDNWLRSFIARLFGFGATSTGWRFTISSASRTASRPTGDAWATAACLSRAARLRTSRIVDGSRGITGGIPATRRLMLATTDTPTFHLTARPCTSRISI